VIRAFLAINLEPQVIEKIYRSIDDLRERIPAVRWVPPTNLHLTVKFFGDIEEAQVEPIAIALQDQLELFPRFTINAKGLGVFPERGRPKILWVGLTGNELAGLAAKVQSSLLPLGFAPEQRSFTPHLTIGRWRDSERAPRTLKQELERWRNCTFGHSVVNEVILMQSVLKADGAVYHRLKVISLGK
jgi:RNA 2',3'-cyclic 3'-phosphodiesterase